MKRPSDFTLAGAEINRNRSFISRQRARSALVFYSLGVLLVFSLECCDGSGAVAADNGTVSYDHRALLIDGQRRFLISGSIHYPRSTPQMWPSLVNLAKEGGLDVIQTYVFWDGHEQQRGKYYFGGRYDLVQFLKVIQDAGLYVNLRIGPYITAEWNFGGFPEWLREIPGIEFRTDNEPFKAEMEKFVTYIVEKMKKHKLFYSQGGPVILAQVENEYGQVESAYKDAGAAYLQWVGAMAAGLNTSVPWTMCKQKNAPGSIIDTCNGFYCDDYVPNTYDKPKIWTENWSGWFHAWGTRLPHRPVEDLAYATARFFQKGGSFVNYYMYHGGTNFGRTRAAGVTTSYDYDAPIDEYGQVSQPKWGHLKAMHAALKLCEPALAVVDGQARNWTLPGSKVEIHVYTNSTMERSVFDTSFTMNDTISPCASFVSNSAMTDITVELFGKSYYLPAWSVSILPDCKNVMFNTAKVKAQTSVKRMVRTPAKGLASAVPLDETDAWSQHGDSTSEALGVVEDVDSDHGSFNSSVRGSKPLTWVFARDAVGSWGGGIVHQGLLEQINTTHDLTDYLWYTTNVIIPGDSNSTSQKQTSGRDYTAWLIIERIRTVVHVFLNGEPAGGYPIWNGTGLNQPVSLKPGNNSIALLSSLVGLWDARPFYESEVGGLSGSIMLQGMTHMGDINLTQNQWTHQVGLKGEKLRTNDTDVGVRKLNWSSGALPVHEPLVWYKIRLNAPEGESPVVLDMSSMGKGAVWVNGHHMGRFWVTMRNPEFDCKSDCDYRGRYNQDAKCYSDCGQPSQRWYHVPREWLQPKGNLLTVFEEIGGNITEVSFFTQVVHTVCSHISESDSPSDTDGAGKSFSSPQLHFDCGTGHLITNIEFASFGDPSGGCGNFTEGDCHAPLSMEVVQEICEGRQYCSLPLRQPLFGADPCPGQLKSLAVQAVCEPFSLN